MLHNLSIKSRKALMQCLIGPFSILLICCAEGNTEANLDLPVIDWSGDIPFKTINLEDIADIRYIPLEVNDSCLIDYITATAMNDEFIAITTSMQNSVLIYDSHRKYVSRVNHQGEGPEEYPWLTCSAVDFDKKEIYILYVREDHIYL